MKNFLVSAVIVAGLFGLKMSNWSDSKTEIRDHLMNLCENEQFCEQAVIDHFDTCWADNAKAPSRRTSGNLDGQGLVTCINKKAHAPLFEYAE